MATFTGILKLVKTYNNIIFVVYNKNGPEGQEENPVAFIECQSLC